jgi:hypothetical protein
MRAYCTTHVYFIVWCMHVCVCGVCMHAWVCTYRVCVLLEPPRAPSYMHACMRAGIHSYTHIHTHTCIHTNVHTCMHTRMHTSACVSAGVCVTSTHTQGRLGNGGDILRAGPSSGTRIGIFEVNVIFQKNAMYVILIGKTLVWGSFLIAPKSRRVQ